MTRPLIRLEDVSLSFSHKTLFSSLTALVSFGARIGVIGSNGTGKSRLLDVLCGFRSPTEGSIWRDPDLSIGFVPQLIRGLDALSGAQKFNESLTKALSSHPSLLMLDEPTNHLDGENRAGLFTLLKKWTGALIVASHDEELLRTSVDCLWELRNGRVHILKGRYSDYLVELKRQEQNLEEALISLKAEKRHLHQALMKEQIRASQSRQKGIKSIENRKWPTVVSKCKAGRCQKTFGKKKAQLNQKKQEVEQTRRCLPRIHRIVPKFMLPAGSLKEGSVLSISEGQVCYDEGSFYLKNLSLTLGFSERIALRGRNGSGKSTLLRAILNDPRVKRTGLWMVPKSEAIGYLDQHYKTLKTHHTVFEALEEVVPHWSCAERRKHLNTFLFPKTEQVMQKVAQLSEGEKARLSLALIAARPPKLLILDEITNNLDIQTRCHVIQILLYYPGALLVVSHDDLFLEKINTTHFFDLNEKH